MISLSDAEFWRLFKQARCRDFQAKGIGRSLARAAAAFEMERRRRLARIAGRDAAVAMEMDIAIGADGSLICVGETWAAGPAGPSN